MNAFQRITVIGAGLMGHGLAQVFAGAGLEVTVYDPFETALASLRDRVRANLRALGENEASAEKIIPCGDLPEAVRQADFIVEAAIENLAKKQQLFLEIEQHARPQAVFASNTSVIPITEIMRPLRDRSRALGAHWWNPPYLVPLVEVIGTEWTSPETIEATLALHRAMGKTAIHVRKDVPGFIGNRLQHALWREAISLIERGICDAADVDAVVKASFGRRLTVLGPIENADLVGTDLTLAIHQTVLPDIESRPAPSPYLEELVAQGRLGMKSGEGFRSWAPEEATALRDKVTRHLLKAREAD